MKKKLDIGKPIVRAAKTLFSFVHWLLDWPVLSGLSRSARLIMSLYVVLAGVLAIMVTTERWSDYINVRMASGSFHDGWDAFSLRIFGSWLIVLAIHLSYWTLLAQDLVFSRREDEITAGNLLLPTGLIVAYGLSASNFHVASICMFTATYAVLLLDELGDEHEYARHLQGAQRRKIVWICIDLVLVFGLSICLGQFYYLKIFCNAKELGSQPWLAMNWSFFKVYGIKDIIILFNLAGYVFAHFLGREWNKIAANVHYRNFLRSVITPIKAPRGPIEPNKQSSANEHTADAGESEKTEIEERQTKSQPASIPLMAVSAFDRIPELNELRRLGQENELVIVDFASCDSRRVTSMLHCLNIHPKNIKLLVGIDIDPVWEPAFIEICKGKHLIPDDDEESIPIAIDHIFCNNFEEVRGELKKAHLVIASHVFHDQSLVDEFQKVVAAAPKAAVIVCGCAPYHFLGGPISESAIQGLMPRPFYQWENSNLSNFVTGNKGLQAVQVTDAPHAADSVDQLNVATEGVGKVEVGIFISVLAITSTVVGLVFNEQHLGPLLSAGGGILVGTWLAAAIYRYRHRDKYPFDANVAAYPPYAVISRRLELNAESVFSFVQWIEIHYGYRMGIRYMWRLNRFLKLMRTHEQPNHVSFHDIVYIFSRKLGLSDAVTLPDRMKPEELVGSKKEPAIGAGRVSIQSPQQ